MNLQPAIDLQRQGRLSEAEAACRRIVAVHPKNAGAFHLLGNIALQRGQVDQAIQMFYKAVTLAPDTPQFRVNLAAVLGQAGRPSEAVPHLAHALRLKGDAPELHNNMGAILEALDRLPEALSSLRNALRLRPDYPEAHFNLGNTLKKMGEFDEAIAAYRQAVRLRRSYVRVYHNLANTLEETGDLSGVIDCYRTITELEPMNAGGRSALLYTLHYHPDYDAQALYREHLEWGRRFVAPLEKIKPHSNDAKRDRRIRVGYVSPDFRDHTVPRFIGAALEHHDHNRFELFAYSDVQKPDATTERLKGFFDHWNDIHSLADERVEKLVRGDHIDILVDLRGHAASNRLTLFARKPAPVQVSMVGYFNTTGLATMDYRITDEHQDPPGVTDMYHVERLVRLPQTCWCYVADSDAPDVVEPPALRASNQVTFGSLNKIIKITSPCARLWAAVLDAVPGSRLLLASATGENSSTLRLRLKELGLPIERVDLLEKTRTRRDYLERFNHIDIGLDTFPFNGITTTCDGLWMGMPLVSLAGATSISRAGRSILHAVGLGELASDTADAFIKTAVALAGNVPLLRELRLGMRQRMQTSPLMDHTRFTRDLEAAYAKMWEATASG